MLYDLVLGEQITTEQGSEYALKILAVIKNNLEIWGGGFRHRDFFLGGGAKYFK